MLYKQSVFLYKFCHKINQEPICYKNLFKKVFRFDLPKNSIIDMSSLRLK